jgi:hypothetical protein
MTPVELAEQVRLAGATRRGPMKLAVNWFCLTAQPHPPRQPAPPTPIHQALASKEQGIIEILRLLQRPEDLARLGDITAEYASRSRSAKATLSAMVQSQASR